MVRNLEAYGLDPCSVANILQQRCQASTTVTPVPGSKDSLQVQIQGNQIHHLGQLLLGERPSEEQRCWANIADFLLPDLDRVVMAHACAQPQTSLT